jgi:hypothetical protein
MSPIGIHIMLHYYACVDDFREGDLTAPAVCDLIDAFTSEGMLEANEPPRHPGYPTKYRITERGEAYVKALCSVPYPINRWVMPDGYEALLSKES